MKHRLRGAAHRALIVALAFVLGVSSLALAQRVDTPAETGTWVGRVCYETPGEGRTFYDCVAAKCWALWWNQETTDAYRICVISASYWSDGPR